jgi:hypothetical protein
VEDQRIVTSRLPHFLDNRLTDGGVAVSLTRLPPFTPSTISGTHFCYRLSRHQGHTAAGRIRSIEKSSDLIGNQTRDLQACSKYLNQLRYRVPFRLQLVLQIRISPFFILFLLWNLRLWMMGRCNTVLISRSASKPVTPIILGDPAAMSSLSRAWCQSCFLNIRFGLVTGFIERLHS